MWVFLALLSAVLVGVYDILKKVSLQGNPVLPVLLVSTSTGALIFLPAVIISNITPGCAASHFWYVQPVDWTIHGLLLIKSTIVGASWMLSYYAVKHLPLTIVSPIRSTGPLWTLTGALLVFGERLNALQWAGLTISLTFFWFFSQAGRREGFSFRSNKWMWCIYAGTLLGAVSGLYDKYLLARIDRIVVQAWFSIYLVPVILPFVVFKWYPVRRQQPLKWRFTIPLIGICLTIADYAYFHALSYPESLVSIVSALRRCSVAVPFLAGAFLFHEKNTGWKAVLLAGMLVGVGFIIWGS
jgi:transporter family protein